MNPINVSSGTYIVLDIENNDKDLKCKVDYYLRISKYKNIFAEGYTPNWSEKVFVIKNVKNAVPQAYVKEDFDGKKSLEFFMK